MDPGAHESRPAKLHLTHPSNTFVFPNTGSNSGKLFLSLPPLRTNALDHEGGVCVFVYYVCVCMLAYKYVCFGKGILLMIKGFPSIKPQDLIVSYVEHVRSKVC